MTFFTVNIGLIATDLVQHLTDMPMGSPLGCTVVRYCLRKLSFVRLAYQYRIHASVVSTYTRHETQASRNDTIEQERERAQLNDFPTLLLKKTSNPVAHFIAHQAFLIVTY